MSQHKKAELFRSYHHEARTLVLPTAWDAASARAFADAGARAIATTSLGMANALGYSDGEAFVPPEELLWLLARIVRAVDVPVTVDIEAGYGDPERMTAEAIKAGAAGLNIEDRIGQSPTLLPIEEAAQAVARVRAAAERSGIPIVVNARSDTLLRGGSVEEAIERSNTYLAAGADCVLPIGAPDRETVTRLVRGIKGPVNLTANATSLPIRELEAIGVRRVSILVFSAAISFAQKIATELLTQGTYTLIEAQQPFPDLNKVFQARAAK